MPYIDQGVVHDVRSLCERQAETEFGR